MLSIDRPNLDWVALSKGMGVDAVRVTDAEELANAFDAGLHSDGPYLIEVAM
jgi:acetolactate synthase-1/2/3 large subunit